MKHHFMKMKNEIGTLENKIFERMYLYRVCNSKVIETSPNEHGWDPQILFEGSFKIKKGRGQVSRPPFS